MSTAPLMDKSKLNNIPALKADIEKVIYPHLGELDPTPDYPAQEWIDNLADQIIKLFQEYMLEHLPEKRVEDSNDLTTLEWHDYAELPTATQADVDAAHDEAIDQITSILTNNGGAE